MPSCKQPSTRLDASPRYTTIAAPTVAYRTPEHRCVGAYVPRTLYFRRCREITFGYLVHDVLALKLPFNNIKNQYSDIWVRLIRKHFAQSEEAQSADEEAKSFTDLVAQPLLQEDDDDRFV